MERMKAKRTKQILLWSVVLILLGVLLLVNQYIELRWWVWFTFLAVAGLVALGLYLTDRSDELMLLATYVLWAVAGLVALVAPEILQDEAVALYVLLAIALPFLVVYLRNRALWWALIPAYTLAAVAGVVALGESGRFSDNLITAYVLFAIAIPFLFVYARNRSQWWFLIPGGILAIIGLAFLFSEGASAIVGAAVMIGIGVWFLARVFFRKEPEGEARPPAPDVPAATAPDSNVPEERREE
jgi:uncharacterized membrane protein HdeD (DUF308 family)